MERHILDSAAAVSATARSCAAESEAARRLVPEVVEALAAAGMFTLCLPVRDGGPGVSPNTLVDALVEVARGDGAAGWCAAIASTTSSLAAYLDTDVAAEIFPTPATATGGVFAPNGRGTHVGDRFEVTGRWQWGSGTQHCSWIVGGVMCDDGSQRVCFFPSQVVEFHDTWFTSGLRGTGSLDFSVSGVEVAADHAIRPGVDRALVDEPLATFPNFTLLALGVAASALGVARRALDELADLAGGKTPQFSSRTLARSPFTQIEFARAEARWRAARAFLHDEVDRAWSRALDGDPVTVDQRVGMRLAGAHAATECAAVVDIVWTLAGGTAVYDASVLGRCLRDVHVVTQHLMVAPKLNETLGKSLLGVDFDPAMI